MQLVDLVPRGAAGDLVEVVRERAVGGGAGTNSAVREERGAADGEGQRGRSARARTGSGHVFSLSGELRRSQGVVNPERPGKVADAKTRSGGRDGGHHVAAATALPYSNQSFDAYGS
ncbi:hypothetical protein [Nocardioides ungokensis]|uniref:hypothetical protein n=1 Tax=Nocardioides ungokensis TaxID=1643322 RepID=UPI0015DE2A72|nr:hypothetical protein [Nocardioides ungokensis]